MTAGSSDAPEFRPHPLVRGGHAQTLFGTFVPGRLPAYRAQAHRVLLPDGDVLIMHDDRPDSWQSGDPVALLVHGLAGCHTSGYMVRIAHKLNARGVRAFRLDLRGCGAGVGLAKNPYHAGRSEDVRAALQLIAEMCPGSPIGLAGFSLGGNISLKMLGEDPAAVPAAVARAIAVNPSIDLAACVDSLDRLLQRRYDRHFVKLLYQQMAASGQFTAEHLGTNGRRALRLRDFDDWHTAPLAGFGTADTYYALSSSAQFVPSIRVPTLIVTAADDPLVPTAHFHDLQRPKGVRLHVAPSGGHLGYIARGGIDPDRRWIDWRVVDWLVDARAPRGTV